MASAPPTFTNNRALADWTRRGAWAQAALAAIVAGLSFLAISSGAPSIDDKLAGSPGAAGEGLLAVAVLVRFGLFVVTAILALTWLYRANLNARAMGATDMMVSPVLSVVWWFVPLLNLAMPYIAIRDLWRASEKPRDWQGLSAPATILIWWLLWLASNIVSTIGWRLTLDPYADTAQAALGFELVAQLLYIPAALMFAAIVGGIQRLQEQNGPAQLFR